jgi:hypothetical protein
MAAASEPATVTASLSAARQHVIIVWVTPVTASGFTSHGRRAQPGGTQAAVTTTGGASGRPGARESQLRLPVRKQPSESGSRPWNFKLILLTPGSQPESQAAPGPSGPVTARSPVESGPNGAGPAANP